MQIPWWMWPLKARSPILAGYITGTLKHLRYKNISNFEFSWQLEHPQASKDLIFFQTIIFNMEWMNNNASFPFSHLYGAMLVKRAISSKWYTKYISTANAASGILMNAISMQTAITLSIILISDQKTSHASDSKKELGWYHLANVSHAAAET